MNDMTANLATYSVVLTYSAMAVYVIAFISFALDMAKRSGDVRVAELPLSFFPLERDVLSLELDDSFRDLYLLKDSTPVFLMARALMEVQQKHGLFPRIIGKGENAKRVLFGAINVRTAHRVVLAREHAGGTDARAFFLELRRRYRRAGTIWLVLDRGEASVCMQHPGTDSDLVITMPTPALARVFSGADRWASAVARGDIDVAGPPSLAKAMPAWFLWSPWAEQTRERAERAAVAPAG